MATFHVIYDPTNRLTVGPPDRLPVGIQFVAMKSDVPEDSAAIAELASSLTKLLLDRINGVMPCDQATALSGPNSSKATC